ncbi:MAG: hypothetical protein WD187_02595 [Candidatus Woykebacteria bacterium]
MNKYLQILIGITTAVWLVVGIGVVVGFFILINIPTILGINLNEIEIEPGLAATPNILAAKNKVYTNCLETALGEKEANRILLYWENISTASAQKIRSCNY